MGGRRVYSIICEDNSKVHLGNDVTIKMLNIIIIIILVFKHLNIINNTIKVK